MTAFFDGSSYSRALVVGAGSGRDMASGVLITEALRHAGAEVDLGGFLTPWALHTFEGELEKPVNKLVGGKNRKFLPFKESEPLDVYFEPELVELNRELELGIRRFYLFSLHYGIGKLATALERLIAENAYDAVIAMDVGGDILAREKDYSRLLTPMVDFSCLGILGQINVGADRYLAVIAPGVDGEIPGRQLKEIFEELEARALIVSSEKMDRESAAYQRFKRINREINSRTGSQSNTFRLVEKVLEQPGSNILERLEKKIRIGEKAWRLSFPVELESTLSASAYYFELESIHAIRRKALSYRNVFEGFIQMKQLGAGGTEADLSFVPRRLENGRFGEIIFLLTPCQRIEGEERKEIIEYGLALTDRGYIPHALVSEEDLQIADIPAGLKFRKEDRAHTGLVVACAGGED